MKNICNNWDLKDYSYINFMPDASFHKENREWHGCPTVAVTKKGRLFAGWYSGGPGEPAIENYNILAMSDDNGKSWIDPLLIIERDKNAQLRKIDIQLWTNPDNSLWVMWTISPYGKDDKSGSLKDPTECPFHREFPYNEVMICKDPDADVLVWEKPRILCDGFMRNKPIVTTSGRIIAPAYDFVSPLYKLRKSDDGGETFDDSIAEGKPEIKRFDEISVCERRPGELRFLARTNCGYFVYSDSFDDGNTWTIAKEYESAPSSRCYFGKLKNGMIAYVRNVSNTERTGMKICLSDDGGDTFPYEMVLDDRVCVSYPDLDEDENGNIYIVYDRERDNSVHLNRETWISTAAKEILICKLTVDDIKNNTLSEGSFLQSVISKAEINVVRH